MSPDTTAAQDAWQAALAAEHEAVFGYALLGVHLSGAEQQLAVSCSDAHEALRTDTADAIAAAGLTPVQPAADYPALYPVGSAVAAGALAVRLEEQCAAAWRYLYARTAARSVRTAAQQALTAAAVRAVRWRTIVDPAAASTAFPGI